ncbi:hypothetical protein SUNI508_10654 [Seiridium unicorne]|uniref:AB hydrolase-1 domain-containing protein n=1 Tax=Seiridium unicorne TaxID=138068 RepID=A0ABR2UKZ5_9PEZI
MPLFRPWSLAIQFPVPARIRRGSFYAVTAHRHVSAVTTDADSTTSTTNWHPDRCDQTLSLPDGRTIGFAEAGCPTGYPLFYFHGFPSSRLEARGLEEIGQRHNIRIIATDRPGYGLSSFQPNRRITDWSTDIKFLANHLGIERFAVLGGSGGGPYALACAHALPRESLSATGLLASAASWESGYYDVPLSARLTSWAATYFPSPLCWLMDLSLGLLRRALDTNAGKKFLDSLIAKAAATVDKKVEATDDQETIEERRNRALQVGFESFAHGSRGVVQEAYLLTHPYGFRLEDMRSNKIYIWHGAKDVNSPIRMVRWMNDRLQNSELNEFEHETHFTIVKHLEAMVTTLIPGDEIKAYRQGTNREA